VFGARDREDPLYFVAAADEHETAVRVVKASAGEIKIACRPLESMNVSSLRVEDHGRASASGFGQSVSQLRGGSDVELAAGRHAGDAGTFGEPRTGEPGGRV
jgi:hypothetical protein